MENKPDIISTIEREGYTVKRKGRALWLSCPFHEDKTPSLKINPDKQTFYCFSCNNAGDSISFIQKLHSLSFKDACRYLNIIPGKPLPINPTKEKQKQLLKAFEKWRQTRYFELCDHLIEIHSLRIKAEKRKPLPEYMAFWLAEKLAQIPSIEHQLDILSGADDEAKFELFQEVA